MSGGGTRRRRRKEGGAGRKAAAAAGSLRENEHLPILRPSPSLILGLDLPIVPPSLNRRLHPIREYREKKKLRSYIGFVLAELGALHLMTSAVTPRRRLELEIHLRKLRDDDNLWGGCKILIDALRHYRLRKYGTWIDCDGLFYDDSPKYLDLAVTQVEDKTDWTAIRLFRGEGE